MDRTAGEGQTGQTVDVVLSLYCDVLGIAQHLRTGSWACPKKGLGIYWRLCGSLDLLRHTGPTALVPVSTRAERQRCDTGERACTRYLQEQEGEDEAEKSKGGVNNPYHDEEASRAGAFLFYTFCGHKYFS